LVLTEFAIETVLFSRSSAAVLAAVGVLPAF